MRVFLSLMIMAILGGSMNAQDKDKVEADFIIINDVAVPLIFEESKNLPIGNLQLVFVGGSADGEIAGLGAMSANMLNEGTKGLGNVGFAQKLESKAISLQASVGLQTLSLSLSYLKEFEHNAFEFLGMLLDDPNLTMESLEKIKMLSLSKLARAQSDFDDVAQKNLNKILFKGTPLAIPLIGDKQSIESITLEDIEAFLKRNLVLNRLIIVAGGDMQEEKLKKELTSLLEHLPKGEAKARLHFEASRDADSIVIQKPTEQAFIYFGAPFDVGDKEKNYMAKVMGFILGASGFGSRILEEVRVKRGLAYSASMRINVSGSANYASGYLQTKLESKDEAIEVVKEVVNDFITNGAKDEELQAAKAFLLGSEPLLEETLASRLSAKFVNYFQGLPLDNRKRELALIKDLSLEALNAYIKSHKEVLQMSFAIVEATSPN